MNKLTLTILLIASLFLSYDAFSDECQKKILEKVVKCEPYECEDFNERVNGVLKRKILGKEGDKCHFIVIKEGDYTIECRSSDSLTQAVIKYAKDLEPKYDENGTLIGKDNNLKYDVDGVEVSSPVQYAFESGACVRINEEGPGN